MRARNTLKVQRVVSLILEMNPSELVALRQQLGADFNVSDSGVLESRPQPGPTSEYKLTQYKLTQGEDYETTTAVSPGKEKNT